MSSATYVPGQAVQLSDGRLATVRFFGQTLFAPGTWVGVELGDASGKNDGVVQGERYFDCPPMHGMFLRPIAVKPAPAAAVPAPAPLRHVGAPPTPTYAQPPTPSRLVSGGFGAGGAGAGAGAGAKKTSSRPSSLLAGQKTVVVQDPSLGRRMSLNAPSPSPGPKSSRPSSIARVGYPFLSYTTCLSRLPG